MPLDGSETASLGLPDALSLGLRVGSFVLLLNAAGIAVFLAVFGRLLSGSSSSAVTRLGCRLAFGALLFVAAHQALEAARMAGEMGGLLDGDIHMMALRSSAGAGFALQVVGMMLVGTSLVFCRLRGQASPGGARALSVIGAFLTIVAFTLTGHTSVTPHRVAAATLLTLHLLTVSFWIGALWPLYLATYKETPAVASQLIDAFSRVAVWWVPVILLAGVGLSTLLLPDLSAFQRPYGQLLLAKVTLFAILMGLAALNKSRLGPACATGDARAFRRSVIAEYVLICAVMAVTATMTTLFSPEKP